MMHKIINSIDDGPAVIAQVIECCRCKKQFRDDDVQIIGTDGGYRCECPYCLKTHYIEGL